jgi:hypothetical protein
MFGAAETDFQPHRVGRIREQRAQIGRRRFARIEREAGQQCIEQRGLPRLERMPFAAAEKGACSFSVITGPPRSGVTR